MYPNFFLLGYGMIFLTLFLVGLIFLVANIVLVQQRQLQKRADLVTGEDTPDDMTVVYRYLPRDIDEFYRSDASIPSKIYSDMFTGDDDALRIR